MTTICQCPPRRRANAFNTSANTPNSSASVVAIASLIYCVADLFGAPHIVHSQALREKRLSIPRSSATTVDGAQTQRNSLISIVDASPLKKDAIPIGEVARGRQGKK